MTLLDIIGYAAAVCTTFAYAPQVVQTWRSRSTGDVSLKTLLLLVSGLGLWFAYGLLLGELPIIAANGIALALTSIILFFKLRYG